ncbi:MAG TPA: hypothetical protein VLE89_02525 [Chlamydiales bacterium]|nr:hypothetical protein [Chlamydiales bacterium]
MYIFFTTEITENTEVGKPHTPKNALILLRASRLGVLGGLGG